jgi:hypothetical protein
VGATGAEVGESGNRPPLAQVVAATRPGQGLLVLDTFEQVTRAATRATSGDETVAAACDAGRALPSEKSFAGTLVLAGALAAEATDA